MTKIALIGTGPCGLSFLRSLHQAEKNGDSIPEVVAFEKQGDWGGLWNYTWRTGSDQFGDPIPNSMYRYLWSNGPKECLEFADYSFDEHFQKPIPSFPPREVLQDYILGRAEKSDVKKYVKKFYFRLKLLDKIFNENAYFNFTNYLQKFEIANSKESKRVSDDLNTLFHNILIKK